MNRERKVRPHPGPLPRGEGEDLVRIRRSWSQCMCERKLRLSMYRRSVAASRQSAANPRNHFQRRSPETRLRRGSWSQCAFKRKRRGSP
jgi:hypothetical protein